MCHIQEISILRPPSLEVVSIAVTSFLDVEMCVIAVYRRPQLPLSNFLSLLESYVRCIQHQIMPTLILGDFNENLLNTGSSRLQQFMSSLGFLQLVSRPTTDSGSLLDHIYFNRPTTTKTLVSLA